MKLLTRSLAAFAVLALSHSAMATVNVYVTGSSAFRNAAETVLSGNTVFDTAPTIASVGTAVGSTFVNFTGTINGNSVRIKCSFTGSAGGIYLVAHNGDATPPQAPFLPDGATGTANVTPTAGNGGDIHTCDIAFSDAYQLSSAFPDPSVVNDSTVGIVTFKWVGNYSLAQNSAGGTPITNITSQHVKALFSGAFLASAAQLTGSTSSTDQSIFIFAVGRDFDSGTRITAFADAGNGSTTSPSNWQPFMNTQAKWVGTPAGSPLITDTAVTGIRGWNASVATTLTGPYLPSKPYTLYNNVLTVAVGDGGFNSGGDLAKMMRSDSNTSLPAFYNANLKGSGAGKIGYHTTTCTGAYFITALGIGDAATALNPVVSGNFGLGACKELAYNGIAYSNAAIQQGQYSMWGYEHLMSNDLSGSTEATDAYNKLVDAVTNNADTTQGGAGLLLSSMKVNRATDGDAILATYY